MEVLANWLVQGTLVALATACVLQVLQRARAQARYWVCLTSWVAVLVLPLMPLLAIVSPTDEGAAVVARASAPLVSMPVSPIAAQVVVAAWFIWVAVHVIQLAKATAWVRWVRSRSQAFPSALDDRLRHWARVKGQGRRTRLVMSDDVRAAAVIGCGAPVIAISPELVERLTADELDRVVIHEWAHVQRRDDVLAAAQLIARTFAGWHPAAWWLGRQLQLEREAACDETAVSLTGSSKYYAACLLKLAALPLLHQERSHALGVLSSPAVAIRIRRIVTHEHDRWTHWSTRGATVGIALLGVVSCVVGSLQVVHAARVPLEHSSVPAILHPVSALRPPGESHQAIAPALDSPPPVQPPQEASRPPRVVITAPPSIAGATSSEPATGTAVLEVPHEQVEQTVVEEDSRLDEPIADTLPRTGSTPDANAAPVSPWAATANAGVSLGTQSKKGGVATAAFFTRLGKRVAGSF